MAKRLPASALLAYAAFLLFSLTALGVLLEGRRAGTWLEAARLAATALAAVITGGWFGVVAAPPALVPAILAASLGSAAALATIRLRTRRLA